MSGSRSTGGCAWLVTRVTALMVPAGRAGRGGEQGEQRRRSPVLRQYAWGEDPESAEMLPLLTHPVHSEGLCTISPS